MAAGVNGRTACGLLRRFVSFPKNIPLLSRRVLHGAPRFIASRRISSVMSSTADGGAKNGFYSIIPGTEWTMNLAPPPVPETVIEESALTCPADFLAVGVFSEAFKVETDDEGNGTVTYIGKTLTTDDPVFNKAVDDILAKGDFKGEAGQSAVVRVGGDVKTLGLFGLGKQAEAVLPPKWGRSVYYKFGAGAGNAAKSCKSKNVSIAFDITPTVDISFAVTHVLSAMLLEPYESSRFKEKPKTNPLKLVKFLNVDPAAESGVKKAQAVAEGTTFTIQLVESPPNVCYPQHLVDAAELIVEKFPANFSLKVLEKEDCEKMKMGLYLGVANASDTPPKFIHLTYSKGNPKEIISLVGKGITMDTGGYNLKVNGRIEDMKFDMGGAGAVLGAAYILGSLKPEDTTVHFIIASCENMISGKGCRPGDIIKASNGKSVEVINTDAEGRLTLADALLYAQNECKATSIINSATLTGAIIVALGEKIAGMFTPSDAMASSIEEASKRTGDRVWRMPLESDYLTAITKGIADLKNVGGRAGGSITAGLFLKEFVKTDDVEWAHLDIAGTAYSTEKSAPTGFGAALFAEWVLGKTSS